MPLWAADKAPSNPQTVSVHGLVTDNNRKPLVNAHVRFFLEWWDDESIGCAMGVENSIEAPSTQTDKNGRYSIRIATSHIKGAKVPPKAVFSSVTIIATYPNKGLAATSRGLSEIARPVDLQLDPEKILTGTVVDSAGHPVAGARVAANYVNEKVNDLRFNTHGLFVLDGAKFLKTITDRKGRFSLSNLPQGSHVALDVAPRVGKLARVSAHMVMDAPSQAGSYYNDSKELSADRPVKIVLPPASSLTVQVSWGDSGEPAAGAWLQCGNSRMQKQVRTDAKGSVVMHGLPPGVYYATLRPPLSQTSKYKILPFKFEVAPGKDLVLTRTLDPGIIVKGQVSDAQSNKPMGETIRFVRDATGPDEEWSAESGTPIGPDGTFEIALSPGHYSTMVIGLPEDYPDHNTQKNEDIEITAGNDPAPLLLKYSPSRSVTVQVVDPQNKPVSTAFVALDLSGPFWPDSKGRVVLHGMEPDSRNFAFVVEEKRGLAALATISAKEEDSAQRVILRPIAKGHGRIVDSAGRPIAGARITAMVETSERAFQESNSQVSGADGYFTLDVFPEATYLYTVNAPGFGKVESSHFRTSSGKTSQAGFIKLRRANLSVSGQVVDSAGNPAKDVRLRVSGLGQNDFRTPIVTDEAGRFTIRGLVPGKVTLYTTGANGERKEIYAGSRNVVLTLSPTTATDDSSDSED